MGRSEFTAAATALGLALVALLSHVGSAHAEVRENVVGLDVSLLMPQFESDSPTAFATAAPATRLWYAFGLTSELYVVARGSVWRIGGATIDGYQVQGHGAESVVGNLRFSGQGYRAELGAKYKLVDGYNLAPYLEAYAGLQWATYRHLALRGGNAEIAENGDLAEFARGSVTASVGASLDYRLANMLFVGAGASWTRVFDDIYRQDLTASVMLAYYWF